MKEPSEKTVHQSGIGDAREKGKIVSLKNPEAFIARLYQIDPDGPLYDTIVNYIGEERFERMALKCYNAYRFDEEGFVSRVTNLPLQDDPMEDPNTLANFLNSEIIRLIPKRASR